MFVVRELVLFFDGTIEDADGLAILISLELGVTLWLFFDEAKGCFVG
ncbi:MAG: hypothetical protein Q7U68_04895 [Candidatus Roizmanbacteria bacterium]|nr:hypothetical protein [Candidatus Roizmanbacteria bacterium]